MEPIMTLMILKMIFFFKDLILKAPKKFSLQKQPFEAVLKHYWQIFLKISFHKEVCLINEHQSNLILLLQLN